MRNVDQFTWSFDVDGFIWSEGDKYDAKDWRVVLDRDTDIISRVDWESGTVGVLDSNVERMRGVSYEAFDMETYVQNNQRLTDLRRGARNVRQGSRRCGCKIDDERAHE